MITLINRTGDGFYVTPRRRTAEIPAPNRSGGASTSLSKFGTALPSKGKIIIVSLY